jgi:hypothetical protein
MSLVCVGCKTSLPESKQRPADTKYPCCGAEKCRSEGRRLGKLAIAAAKRPKVSRAVPKKACMCGRPGNHSYVCTMAAQGKTVTRDPRIVALAERALAA